MLILLLIAYSVITLLLNISIRLWYSLCLLLIYLFLFLCCKYRPFFPIFFYIIPTKICKILFFCKKPLFPSFFLSFFSPSFSSIFLLHLPFLSLFPLPFSLLYPSGWVRCSSAASLSLLSCLPYNPLKSNHSPLLWRGGGGEAS